MEEQRQIGDARQQYVNARELEARLGIPRNTLYYIAKHGNFPTGIKIGRARRWLASEVEAYLAAQSQHEQEREEFTRQLLSGEMKGVN
ncbi:MAG: helix-turn-helix domain-containing protein [Ruminococcus sp.]|nr:helix-turn-helix domain-containing protein [Synergistaceae bacterium]MBR1751015.1 helix-turn-helix domain-containing protein [Ruminococcus sp.]